MDRILIILGKKFAPILGLFSVIFKHVNGIYSGYQVSVYRTIGPLVSLSVKMVILS